MPVLVVNRAYGQIRQAAGDDLPHVFQHAAVVR